MNSRTCWGEGSDVGTPGPAGIGAVDNDQVGTPIPCLGEQERDRLALEAGGVRLDTCPVGLGSDVTQQRGSSMAAPLAESAVMLHRLADPDELPVAHDVDEPQAGCTWHAHESARLEARGPGLELGLSRTGLVMERA